MSFTPLYIAWTLMLVAAIAYQIRASEEPFPRWFTAQGHAGRPFFATLRLKDKVEGTYGAMTNELRILNGTEL